METKQCTKCGEFKELSAFSKDKRRKDGLQSQCKECYNVYYKANADKMLEYRKKYYKANADKMLEYRKEYYKANADSNVLLQIKDRARKKGLEFNLELEDILGVTNCPVFGWELKRGKGHGPKPDSPSVDRILPELGYVKGNIQILSNKANMMKQDATPEELLMFADWIYKTYQK